MTTLGPANLLLLPEYVLICDPEYVTAETINFSEVDIK